MQLGIGITVASLGTLKVRIKKNIEKYKILKLLPYFKFFLTIIYFTITFWLKLSRGIVLHAHFT